MEDITTDKISEILNSPDLMNNIQNILSGLNLNKTTDIVNSKDTKEDVIDVISNISENNLLSNIGNFLAQNKNERVALLSALRPFLSDEKQETLDLIIQILKAVNIFLAANILTQ